MLAYNSDPALKDALLAQIRWHRQADLLVRGSYGTITDDQGHDIPWRGCAIGCSLRSLDIVQGRTPEITNNDHSRFPNELGIPIELAHLADRFFENLPTDVWVWWPERFAAAIAPGADLALVWPRFALWLLVDADHGVWRLARTDRAMVSIAAVAGLFTRRIAGDVPSVQEWRDARAAAYSDASATYAAAADASASYAAADAAAHAAADASADASAAYAAAYASAAYDAARNGHCVRMADQLEALLQSA